MIRLPVAIRLLASAACTAGLFFVAVPLVHANPDTSFFLTPHPHTHIWFLIGGVTAMFFAVLIGGILWSRLLRRRLDVGLEELDRQKTLLRESESRFRLLVENQHDFMILTDADFLVEYVSPSYCQFRGGGQENLVGQVITEAVHPDESEAVRSWAETLSRPPFGGEALLRSQSHQGWRWTHWKARGVLDGDRLQRMVFVGRDSHRRVEAQKALGRSLEQERILRSCGRRLLGRIGTGPMLRESLEELRSASAAQCMAVFVNKLDDRGRDVTELVELAAADRDCRTFFAEHGNLLYTRDLPGWWKDLARGRVVSDMEHEAGKPLGDLLKHYDISSWSALPLVFNDSWQGFLLIAGDMEDAAAAAGETFLSTAADMIGAFLGRKEALYALRTSEERYSLAVEGSRDGLWDWDFRTNKVYFSPRWKEILGYDRDELSNTTEEWKKRIHPDDYDLVMRAHEEYMSRRTERMEIEYRLRHKDGSYRWIAGKGVCLWDKNGDPYRMAGTHTDITERKRIERNTRVLYRVSRAMNSIRDLRELYGEIAAIMHELLETECLMVALLDRSANILHYPFVRDVRDGNEFEEVNLSTFEGRSLVMDVVRSEKVLFFDRQSLEGVECIGTLPVVWLGAPIKQGSVVVGAVVVQDYEDEFRFVEQDADMLASVAELISMAMERTRNEEDLRASEESYRNLFRSAQVGLFRSSEANGRVLECNEQFAEMLGYSSRTQCIRQCDMNRHYAPSHSRNRLIAALHEQNEVKNYELPMLRLDGKLIWVRYSVNRHREKGWLEGVCEDMTVEKSNRREREILLQTLATRNAELGKAREYVKSIIQSMPSVLVSLDSKLNVVEWNHEAERMTGLSAEHAAGRPLYEVMPSVAEHRDKVAMAMESNEPVTLSRVKVLRGDSAQYLDAIIYPLSDEAGGAVIRVDDVTSRVQIEEMMVQTEKMLSVGGLAAGMAHEINNPLGIILQGIQGATRRLSTDIPANRKAAEKLDVDLEKIGEYMQQRGILGYLEGIREAGMRASRIVSNMLNFSRTGSSNMEPNDINALIDHALSLAGSDYDLKKRYDFRYIQIKRDYAPDLPKVPCQATEIEQVVLNLLKNAAHAFRTCPEPEEGFRIRLATRLEESYVTVEVEDNGPGMAEETARRVFEPFYTTKEPGVGTGLGLSVSYFIITQNHSGRFRVDSTLGQGTAFVFQLPLGP